MGGLVRNMVFFELFPSYFYDFSLASSPPPSFLSSFTLPRKDKTCAIDPISRRAQRTTTTDDPFKRYLRGSASG